MNEVSLIQECKKGNRKAQETFYNQFAPRMMGVCIRYSPDRDSANDLMQEGFIKVFYNLKEFKGTGSLEGWMRKIFINCALEKIRKSKFTLQIQEIPSDCEDSFPSAVEELTATEMLQLIQQLPEGYRIIFNLFAIEGFTHKEISEMLNISEGTSRSQYTRARQALQKKIKNLY